MLVDSFSDTQTSDTQKPQIPRPNPPGTVISSIKMGKTFGNLYYIRNIVYYKVSSYEQKAFPNFFKESIFNFFNELKTHGPYAIPPLAIGYLYIQWGVAERERMIRKDPNLYKDD